MPLRQQNERACIKEGKSQVANGLQFFFPETAEVRTGQFGELEYSGPVQHTDNTEGQSPPQSFANERQIRLKFLKKLTTSGIKSDEKETENLEPRDGPAETPGNCACSLQRNLCYRPMRVGAQRFVP